MTKKTLLPVAAILACALTMAAATRSPKDEISRNLEIFNRIFKVLQTSYVDSIDAEKSVTTAIDAMLDEIDPYTEFIPANERADFESVSTGEFGGIGAFIRQLPSGETYIAEPQEDTPSARYGLKAGDIILTIDGDTVTSLGSSKVSERLRGPAGTRLTVGYKRPYAEDSIRTVDITRAKIEVRPVPFFGVVRDTLGYIALTTYNGKSADQVRHALTTLLADTRVKAIALDLRNNGGGLVDEAIDIVGMFVPKGTEVICTRGRDSRELRTYKTTAKPIAADIPLMVFINGNSASAAEITAGALQDLDRAVIIGERSFGKALVQRTQALPGDNLVKLTIAKYYIPSGRCIQAIDYSHRNPDGSVARIPDSLTNVFRTRAGREVRDGGGITPDIKIEPQTGNDVVYTAIRDNLVFDFATKYAAEHPTIPAPQDFAVTDEIYDAFKASIDPAKFKKNNLVGGYIDNLEKFISGEDYMDDNVRQCLDSLRSALTHDLNYDLDRSRAKLAPYIAEEILKRYYFNRGFIENSVQTDDHVRKALDLVADPAAYRRILGR